MSVDVAIVGGGLCGIALAHSLQARGVSWRLFEARDRLGGRIRTVHAAAGTPLDLGPSWYWPDTQPQMARLVADLGLASLAQPDDGQVRLLDDPNRPPRDVQAGARGSLHAGARRLEHGMGALVAALAAPLPPERVRLRSPLAALALRNDGVELRLADGQTLHARRVVLALPPRLAARLHFEPLLPPALVDALEAAPTWMATAAKAASAFPQPFWRVEPHRGNAWVTHPQAMLAETWDASGPAAPALAGFVAPGVALREKFRRGLPMLIDSQLAMLFGPCAAEGELHLADWATEPFTCSPRDHAEDGVRPDHAAWGDARLQAAHWGGRLRFGGSETAAHGGGYLEGALQAAARLRRELCAAPSMAEPVPGR